MADRLTINGIAFDVLSVPAPIGAAVLRDPVVAQVRTRVVWSWDGAVARFHGPVTEQGAVPLANALVFFAPVVLKGGAVAADPAKAKRQGERFLEATGAVSVPEAVKAISGIVPVARKVVPLSPYEALKPSCTFELVQGTDYLVVQLVERAKELSAWLCLPNRVSYRHKVGEVRDPEALEPVAARLDGYEPSFAVPARSRAAKGLRRIGLEQRGRDLLQAQKVLPEGVGGAVARDNLARAALRLEEERQAIGLAPRRVN
ncbi:hypothetical protein [Histidinibacterium lentulum]|uniref:Uncharacterized protein n=1 Tax=Histidinibacterium lentulum TaxID=2480588 RepID=A0A3N2R5Y2_9RHOB|nr:hypothetical protein [Histidinibacterium lentulum]ROU02766.1 hypothetical protein EAT49_10645 [Histidinibacterium lentulum]